MTPPKKPDWMEIADNDGGPINPVPVAKKSRPLLVAMAVLTLTFGGAVIAQTNQQNPGSTQQPLLVQASQSAPVAIPATSAIAPVAIPATSAAPSVKNGSVPAIGIPPSANSGDDEDDDEDYEDEDEDHEDHEDDEDDDRNEH